MKNKLFTCLVFLFTVLIATGETRDFGTYDLYYNSDLDWVIYDNQNNQHPASMVFGFRPCLNLHWSFEDLLLNRVLLFNEESDESTVEFNIIIDGNVEMNQVWELDTFNESDFYQEMRSIECTLFRTGIVDMKFELVFNDCSYWPSNGGPVLNRLEENTSIFILDEYIDISEDIDLNAHYTMLNNFEYEQNPQNGYYTDSFTQDIIIPTYSSCNEPNSSVIFVEGFDFFETGMQYTYFSTSELFNDIIQNNDIYYMQFNDTHKDLRINSMSLAKAIEKVSNMKRDNKPMTIVGFSAGGVISRFTLAWMEERNINHNSNHLLMVDSPLRGAWLNQDIQTFLYGITIRSEGTELDPNEEHAGLIASSTIKNTLRSPAARQILRNNRYAEGLNVDSSGSLDSNYFYSLINTIDNDYYNSLPGVLETTSIVNNDPSHQNNKPGYPYKQNNIICTAVSLGSLISNSEPAPSHEFDNLLSFYINSSCEVSYSLFASVWEVMDEYYYNSFYFNRTIECNDDSDFWPGSKLPISFDGYNIDEDISGNISSALYNANIDIDFSLTLGLSVFYSPTFIPTFSALDIQSEEFNFAVTNPEDVPRQITFNHLSSSPISIDNLYYQRNDDVQHAYSCYDYTLLRNNSNQCFINDYLENSNNPSSPYGISSHTISGNITTIEGSPLINSSVAILGSSNENLGLTVTDENGYYSLPINTLDSNITVKVVRNDIYTQNAPLNINCNQNEYSVDLSCMEINNEMLYVSEYSVNGREFFGSISSAISYIHDNIPQNINQITISLISNLSNGDVFVELNTEITNRKITVKGNNKSFFNSLNIFSINSSLEIENVNFMGIDKAIESVDFINTIISFRNCSFENNNSAVNFDQIGNSNIIEFDNCTFNNNSNNYTSYEDYDLTYLNSSSIIGVGGAIYINAYNTIGNSVKINNCSFTDNHAKVVGAVFIKGIPNTTVESSTFIDNYIDVENIDYGYDIYKTASLYIHDSSLNLKKCVFDELNEISSYYRPATLLSVSGNSELSSLNNTFINNYSGRSILCYNSTQVSSINDIFLTRENQYTAVGSQNGSQVELTNCLVYGYGSSNPVPVSSGYVVADPLLDSDYRPIWTLTQQSPCIEAGVRDLDGDGSWWFEDKDDQDVFGTRPEIGAIPADMDGWGHVLPADQVRWICFPYTLNDPSRYELSYYLEGIQVSHASSLYNNINTSSQATSVFGQKGFKIKASRNEKIDHFGKPVGHPLHYPSGNQITLSRLPFAQSGSNLIGYYKEESCNPMDAFQELLDSGMIESVKGEDWTIYYGYPQSPKGSTNDLGWHLISHTGKRPSLDLGEAVDVIYCGESEQIEFNWSDGLTVVPKVKSTKPVTFAYEEKENYLPLQVKIADFAPNKSSEPFGELGVYINGQCKGAGIIADSVVTVFAYLDSLVFTENDTISFVMHDYNDSKSVKRFADYSVYDSVIDNYVRQITHKVEDEIVFFDLTSKDDQQSNALPVTTEIRSIYPNPFNPETTIEFNLKENSQVNIRVYNLKGQLVKTIINSKLEAGNHKIVWNGTNSNEQRVASGLYFCKMETNDKSVTKKMILMK